MEKFKKKTEDTDNKNNLTAFKKTYFPILPTKRRSNTSITKGSCPLTSSSWTPPRWHRSAAATVTRVTKKTPMAWHHGVLAKRSAHTAIGRWNCCQSWRNHINLLVGLSPVVKFHVELFCGHFLGGKWATLIPWSIPRVCLLLLDGGVPINCPRKTWKLCSLEIEWTRWGGCSWCTTSFHQLLLMAETSWYDKYPIIYRVSYIPGGAGFLPSTVGNTIINQYMTHYNSWHSICYSWRVLTLELRHDSSEFDTQSSWW